MRSAWPWTIVVIISSFAPVSASSCSSPLWTVSGEPMMLEPKRSARNARSISVYGYSAASSGVGIAIGRPRRRLRNVRPDGLQGAELLGDHQRRVVGQHDPARADADALGGVGDVPDQHGRRRAGDPRHVVVLGEPVAVVAQPFRGAGEVQGVAQRLADGV